jgi:hypothetical protein
MPDKDTFSIEPGKLYRLNGGSKYRCYAIDRGGAYCVHGAFLEDGKWKLIAHTKDGTFNTGDRGLYDIISEWVETPVVNWAAMPSWAEWVAMDSDNAWYWFTEEPSLRGNGTWLGVGGGFIPKQFNPAFTGIAKDSLTQRPAPGRVI